MRIIVNSFFNFKNLSVCSLYIFTFMQPNMVKAKFEGPVKIVGIFKSSRYPRKKQKI